MGVNNIPGINIFKNDQSDIIQLGVSFIVGMVGEFDRCYEDLISVNDINSYKNKLGYIDNAPNKLSYISGNTILESGEAALYVAAIAKNARYGGLYITDQGLLPFPYGYKSISKNTIKDFEFYQQFTDEVLDVGNGIKTSFNKSVLHPTIKVGSASIEYYINNNKYTAIDNGLGVFVGNNIASSSINYNTGEITVIFTIPLDNGENLTITYNQYSDQYYKDNLITTIPEYTSLVGISDGSTLSFSTTVANTPIKPGTAKLLFVVGGVLKNIIDNGSGSFIDANIDSGTINYNTGEIIINYLVAPDIETNINIIYNKNILIYSYITPAKPIKIESIKIKYTLSTVEKIATDDGDGNIVGDGLTGTVNYINGIISLTFTVMPDSLTNISIDYVNELKYLAALISRSGKSWSDNLSVVISEISELDNTFKIDCYEDLIGGNTKFVKSFTLSRDINNVDGFGRNQFFEQVINSKSIHFFGKVNAEYENTLLPKTTSNNIYCAGGYDGDSVTDTERVAGLNLFYSDEVDFDDFCGCGSTSKNFIDAVINLVNNKNKQFWMDGIDGDADEVVLWVNNVLNIDSMNTFCYVPQADVSYNGLDYPCPMSSIALKKRGIMIGNGKYFMPPAGVGENYGSINVVRLARYYDEADQLKLNRVGVNVVRKLKGYGNVIYNDLTMQKKLSQTSYINSVITLNKMVNEFANALPVLNLNRVINDDTYTLLRTLIEGFLRQLESNEGTIEPESSEYGWVVRIEELNGPEDRDNKEINAEVLFSFQSVLQRINLTLTYMSNQLIAKLK